MNKILVFFAIALLLNACGNTNSTDTWPEDLQGKKAVLKAKRSELRNLEKEVARLEKEIEELDPEKAARTLVTTMPITRKEFRHFVEIQGSVQSDDYAAAVSEVPGRILNVAVKEGQRVSKGQLIATLDVEQVDKQVAELEKSLELAVDIYERQKRLWDQNIGSEMQYLQAKNNKERLEKSLETVKHQLTKAKVFAPISGSVETVFLKAGELASPGVPIVQILSTRKVKVVAAVPEKYLLAVKKGETVKVKFPALDMEKEARVSLISNTINFANRTFDVEVDLPNNNGLFKPNLLAIMLLNDLTKENVITVPLELVQQEVSGKDFVYVEGKDDKGIFAKKVYVKTAESFAGEIIIEEGLNGDEQLIAEGARGLAENELIKTNQ